MAHAAQELWDWLRTLDPPFAFLLALPFGVAFAGLISVWVRSLTHSLDDHKHR